MNAIKRMMVICFAVLVLAANLPLCAFATDPVSAATMANALAQAITAYGASQGVSMTFDVTSTDGIGESVHELWNDFKEDIQDNNVPTYDSLAVTMWADIYTKIGNNVGININDTEMPYIDAFWNWLLSGPAEMTKVDDQYYEWTLNQNNTVDPITVSSEMSFSYNGVTIFALPYVCPDPFGDGQTYMESSNVTAFYIPVKYSGNNAINLICIAYQSNQPTFTFTNVSTSWNRNDRSYRLYSSSINWWYAAPANYFTASNYFTSSYRANDSTSDVVDEIFGSQLPINPVYTESGLSVRPYIGDTTPQNVYIPDNEDVNYAPLPYVGGLDIPWDDSLFGDGSGTLTDAQSEAIAGVVDDAITDSLEKTLTLADTDNPDIPAPNEVYIPLLPVELPSFNFSLSGIWHYVVSWVQSLGAWFSLMFQTWSVLPSAITIPVYATAVIVIVLGVYKRFFM